MAWIDRLTNLVRRRDVNREIDEELQFHLESRIRDNIGDGMSPEDARRDALRRFGSQAGIRDATRDADVMVALETIAQDLRFAARSLVRRPGFTSVALLTMALGIGANSAIFTIVESVLLRPLPFSDPDRLQMISYASPDRSFWLAPGLSDRDYLAFREQDRTFDSTATFSSEPLTLTGIGDAVRVIAGTVTPDFFRVLRINPAAGRTFQASDAVQGAEPVAIVSDGLWRSRFGRDPSLVNRRITLDGVAHTVIGVLPAGVSFPANVEVWTPLTLVVDPHLSLSRPVIGRLAAGTTREHAQAALEAFVRTRSTEASASGWIAQVRPLKERMVGNVETSLLVFSGAVSFVLLIACANVVNLLLMRTVSRRQEICTRLAIGASRWRLVRLLVAEGGLLSLGGGLLGIALAALAQPAILALIPDGKLPRHAEIHIDAWVLVFTFGLIVLATIVTGVIPALYAGRDDLASITREATGSSSRGTHRIRHVLVIAEVALALVLLIGAGLLTRSFLRISSVDPGFEPGGTMTMTVDLPPARYASAALLQEFHSRVLSSLSGLPGVRSAAAVNWLPLSPMLLRGDVSVEGRRVPDDYWVMKSAVSSQYFSAMGIPLRGRSFTDADAAGAPGVAIVSETVAHRIWPGEDPIGRRISIESNPKPEDWLTIVGVAGDVRQTGLSEPLVPALYQPYRQVRRPTFLSHVTYVTRTDDDPRPLAPLMRGALQAVDRDQAPQLLASMDSVVAGTIAEPRFQTQLLATFSGFALMLAAIGIYGVLAASIVERQREIGIRMALGASHRSVIGMVMRRTLVLTACGIGLGIAGAAGLTKVISGLLVDVPASDPAAFVAASIAIVVAALLAAALPARRASRVDPIVALRTM